MVSNFKKGVYELADSQKGFYSISLDLQITHFLCIWEKSSALECICTSVYGCCTAFPTFDKS